MSLPALISGTCYSINVGIGGLDKKLGKALNFTDCVKIVKASEPTAYGASFPLDAIGDNYCYAEFGRKSEHRSDTSWKTCIFQGNPFPYHFILSNMK